ncbi:BQ5605_C034g11286 [Microbotryum silenes-dioicae]|uniref:BQ5605_C034g11286 protein n=1 Tax=Microbotryum silenes-dioicae TaxID=796604 RepID=A0A2X0PHN3_9BASI|nr:BQ5605_C034g11286 [Microbotryum silenes-dioicae]
MVHIPKVSPINYIQHSNDPTHPSFSPPAVPPQLKVKPRRTAHIQPCAIELSAMLTCWAASGDLASVDKCKESAAKLHECMQKPKIGGKARAPTINYHLSRL